MKATHITTVTGPALLREQWKRVQSIDNANDRHRVFS